MGLKVSRFGLMACTALLFSIPTGLMMESSSVYATIYLTQGSRGDQVKEVQARLKFLGYFKDNVTGYYGPITTKSVKSFQSAFGLPKVNGVVDDKTWEMLLRATKNFNSSGQAKQPEGEKKPEAVREEKKQPITTNIPQSIGGFNENELKLLEKMCYAEARGEGHEGMVAVCAVVLNRIKTEGFPNNVAGVVYEKTYGHFAFESVKNQEIYRAKPNEATRKAVMEAVNGCDPTNGCTYFYNPKGTPRGSWVWKNVTVEKKMGKHSFGRKK